MTDDQPKILVTPRSLAAERLWGASAIAEFAGVSVDTVYLWYRRGAPIFKPSGQYFALRSELFRWMRSRPTDEGQN